MEYAMRGGSIGGRRGHWRRILAFAGLWSIGMGSCAKADGALLPDLTFQIDCSQNPRPDFDDQVTRYLTEQGFRVLDATKSNGKGTDDPGRHELRAIDRRNRIIRLVSFPRRPNHLTFSLLSAPPTRHDIAFDGQVETFFSRDLICEVSQITTHENGPDDVADFRAEVDRLSASLQVAEGLAAPTSTP
jgi:hypothetical protein